MSKKNNITRNDFFKILSTTFSGIAVVGFIYNYGKTLRHFFRSNRFIQADIHKIDNQLYDDSDIFIVKNNDQIEVLSKKCPHLGCTLQMSRNKSAIVCPCHGSRFNLSGKFISGPAKQNMDHLKYHLDSDNRINIEVED